jgi:hypothetical protein
MPGYKRDMLIPLSGETVPESLAAIDLRISIAGRVIRKSFPSAPNQQYRFIWDGRDTYGRPVGRKNASIRIDYRYPATYYPARADFRRAFARTRRARKPAQPDRIDQPGLAADGHGHDQDPEHGWQRPGRLESGSPSRL